ncbi:mRNA export factor isoform X1 [Archocentrus centrarchus]|uniref:mRNA export factor isoform X1 n=1 Tax=Archocentrus centrarchus TaxID=63155 RepID=UPI0011EA1AC1|nr:mRNA export factor isoform X1 [Archocentrus centrarchus]
MSLFGASSGFGTGGTGVFGSTTTDSHNPMKDVEVTSPPDDSISCLAFSPPTMPGNFLIGGSWANDVRCWEVQDNGQTVPKAQQMHTGPVLDACWSDDGSKVFTASCDKTAKMWDLNSNQAIQIAQHDGPIKAIHWIKAPNYSCVMTGSWDKTLKFWDTRSPNPMMSLQMPERCYCADVVYPMAVVATAERGLIVYQLENQPSEFRRIDSPLKHQHRCVAIFKDKQNKPTGFALGSIEGRVAIHYINPPNPAKDNFTFKCHRSNGTNTTTPSFRQTPGPMPLGCVLCMDQSEGPTQPGVDDSCMTVGLRVHLRGRGLYLAFIWMFWLNFLLFFLKMCPALCFLFVFWSFLQLFILLRFAVVHGLASSVKLGCINKYV